MAHRQTGTDRNLSAELAGIVNILGITAGSESGVCWFKNGQLQLAVSEERITRRKFDDVFPEHALSWILDESGLAPGQIDLICYGFSLEPVDVSAEQTELDALLTKENFHDNETASIVHQRINTERDIDRAKRRAFFAQIRNRFPDTPIYNCSHHEAHQAAAFAPSPFQSAMVVTADGRGDFKSLTIAKADRSSGLTELYASPSWRSLGYFYGRLTHLCGFTANRHEGKVTGLAALGNPDTAYPFVENIIHLDGERISPNFGELYTPFFSNYSQLLLEAARRYRREDIAAAGQRHLENIICQLIERQTEITGLRQVCLAGGVFANVKLNQRIREMPCIDEVFVYPAMSDAGLCAGAVYHYFIKHGEPVRPLAHVYLGPNCNLTGLAWTDYDINPSTIADPLEQLLDNLERQAIIGLVDGRAEFGPRALGHRSIVASAFDSAITAQINAKLRRDDFMPFAPAIASELAELCLIGYRAECLTAQFMTLSFPVTAEFAANSPAAVHVDHTVRPQIVTRDSNPFLHSLLIAWYQRTGGLSLLNTSFNVHEEPIVNFPGDVIAALDCGAVDAVFQPPNLWLSKR
jgi:carbamoyltransferase